MSAHRPVIVLLSGGLDSATCLAIARVANYAPIHTLAFDYGQRHRSELVAAQRLAEAYQARHRVVTIDLRQFGGSALTDDLAVPKDRSAMEMGSGVPITYVPARNTIFLSYALAWAEVLECKDVFIGVNALDWSGYPDCRPEFIAAFEQSARLGTRLSTFTVHAPLIHMTKAQIIRRGIEFGVDYGLTQSCYDPTPDGRACGHCDSCILRKRGFEDAGVSRPHEVRRMNQPRSHEATKINSNFAWHLAKPAFPPLSGMKISSAALRCVRAVDLRVFVASWLILALSGCATSSTPAAPTTKVASDKVERAASTAGMFRVPLILTGQNSALVEMTLNGKPIVLLLDTGAQGTVMDLGIANKLGVKSTASSGFNHGVGAGRVAIRQAEIVTLNMSGFEAHVSPSLQDFSSLMNNWSRKGGKQIVGLLGYDVLRTYGAIIDLNEGAMYLRRPS